GPVHDVAHLPHTQAATARTEEQRSGSCGSAGSLCVGGNPCSAEGSGAAGTGAVAGSCTAASSCAAGGSRRPQQLLAMGEPVGQGTGSGHTEGHHAFFSALAQDAHEPFVEVHICGVQPHKLGGSHSGGVQQFQDCSVPDGQGDGDGPRGWAGVVALLYLLVQVLHPLLGGFQQRGSVVNLQHVRDGGIRPW